MSILEKTLNAVPGGGRVYYSLRTLRRLLALWRDPNRRFLAYPPGHFASPLPDHANIERDHPLLTATNSTPGVELYTVEQLELLKSFGELCREMPFPTQPTPGFRYYYENEFFTYGDAHYLFGIVQKFQPQRVIEVGSGFSSALLLDLRERSASKPQLTFIEPYPTRLNQLFSPGDRASSTLIEKRVQDVPCDVFQKLQANDLLLIDSSHVSKIGSDVNYLFFEVLPRLRPGVLVHIHDIFWPFEYPKSWYDLGWAWNEVYLVRAMLAGGSRYRVVAFPSYLESQHRGAVEAAIPSALLRAQATPTTGASSIWLKIQQ
jgi:predicted O-methyltransferase YrrM